MKNILFPVAVLVMMACNGLFAAGKIVHPYESDDSLTPINHIDDLVLSALRKQHIQPANLCSNEVFVRRVYLDVIGTLPTSEEAYNFMENTAPDKRVKLIDALMERDEFTDYWTLKWCDLLRVKAEFPINLWPNAVQAYNRWIRDAVKNNMPYDQFARELLTSSGSNFRMPQVNFYRAIQGHDPCTIAETVALTFMGTRLDSWQKERRSQMAVFFSRVGYKSTKEWKEEIVYLDPRPVETIDAVLPDGAIVRIQPDKDPRQIFTNWLTSDKNQWFARNIVNRVWAWLYGRGIIDKPDDIRTDNLPSNPELLTYLEKELINSKYDLRRIYRLILNSRTYQQSSISRSSDPNAEVLFAYYPVRRLDAEVLIDALDYIGNSEESYSSAIPEPFTYIPEDQRTIELADGSITSSFLEMFGRPARDTGLLSERNNDPTDAQRLYLLNSSDVQDKIQKSQLLRDIMLTSKGNQDRIISNTYLAILSRYPTSTEKATAKEYFLIDKSRRKEAVNDLAWALINSKEFLYRH